MTDFKPGARVQVKREFENAGRVGEVITDSVERGGLVWVPVMWDDDEDPDWFKAAGLEPEKAIKTHHVTIELRSALSAVDVMTMALGAVRTAFGGACSASGFDRAKLEAELAEALSERNAAVGECHRLRCELERRRKRGR